MYIQKCAWNPVQQKFWHFQNHTLSWHLHKTQNWSELTCAVIGWNICRRWKFLLYWLSSGLAHESMLVRYQIVEIRKRINNHFDSMVQVLGGKVMLQYTGLAKKILDVLRPTQWSALFLNAFKMSWNPAIHCALYTTIDLSEFYIFW